jgi:lysyl-tRNA synthetase class 2
MFPNWLALRKNENWKKKFYLRAKILSLIRNFFSEEGFLEVETPSLARLPGMEPHLDPVSVALSDSHGRKIGGYLITSPEYAMKKLLVTGFPKIFQICKSFRSGETADRLHNPEFTILEWYRAKADYKDIMVDVENLFLFIRKNLLSKISNFQFPISNLGKNFIKYRGQVIDLTPPWPRLTVRDAFKKYAKIDLDKVLSRESMARLARREGYPINRDDRFDDIFFKIFLNKIEPHLGRSKPAILYDWPAAMAALSRREKSDPRYAERFEVYIGGLELGNAFSELTDWKEQRARLVEEKKLRKKLGKEVYDIDEDFINALKIGMLPSGGIAMGVDRIVMLFTDSKSIDEVLFFPSNQIFNQ